MLSPVQSEHRCEACRRTLLPVQELSQLLCLKQEGDDPLCFLFLKMHWSMSGGVGGEEKTWLDVHCCFGCMLSFKFPGAALLNRCLLRISLPEKHLPADGLYTPMWVNLVLAGHLKEVLLYFVAGWLSSKFFKSGHQCLISLLLQFPTSNLLSEKKCVTLTSA